MNIVSTWRELNSVQRKTVVASFLGWTLDAFDFFLLVMVVPEVAKDFGVERVSVAHTLFLTLALRPLGALIFGRLADKYGRRPILMLDVILFAFFEFCSGFAPTITVLLITRALFGIAMGGEWGLGASLTMESIPVKARGAVSGLLQEGYSTGYLLAATVYGLFYDRIGWRGMFWLGAIPAVLVLFIRSHVPESPAWEESRRVAKAAVKKETVMEQMRGYWGRFGYLVILMACFNFFSHGSQDLYPTFLKVQHKFGTNLVWALTVTLNVGAICGGLFFGPLSEKIGRKKTIIIAALLAIPCIPLWAFSPTPVMLGVGVFFIQVCVQGAWGIVPVHLNELSPSAVRATLPGLAYQGGNLLAAWMAPFVTGLAEKNGGNYGLVMAIFIGVVAVALAVVTALGPEAKGQSFGGETAMLPVPEVERAA